MVVFFYLFKNQCSSNSNKTYFNAMYNNANSNKNKRKKGFKRLLIDSEASIYSCIQSYIQDHKTQ